METKPEPIRLPNPWEPPQVQDPKSPELVASLQMKLKELEGLSPKRALSAKKSAFEEIALKILNNPNRDPRQILREEHQLAMRILNSSLEDGNYASAKAWGQTIEAYCELDPSLERPPKSESKEKALRRFKGLAPLGLVEESFAISENYGQGLALKNPSHPSDYPLTTSDFSSAAILKDLTPSRYPQAFACIFQAYPKKLGILLSLGLTLIFAIGLAISLEELTSNQSLPGYGLSVAGGIIASYFTFLSLMQNRLFLTAMRRGQQLKMPLGEPPKGPEGIIEKTRRAAHPLYQRQELLHPQYAQLSHQDGDRVRVALLKYLPDPSSSFRYKVEVIEEKYFDDYQLEELVDYQLELETQVEQLNALEIEAYEGRTVTGLSQALKIPGEELKKLLPPNLSSPETRKPDENH